MKTKTRGQALTEFALILPLLLLLLLGIIEGARIIWAYITVQNAAREAARYAVSGQPLINGDPWMLPNESKPGPDNDRVEYIKAKAVELASGLAVDVYATGPYTDSYLSQADVPNALGVTVWGQPDPNGPFIPDHASEQGLNVTVEVYYNVVMLDPIYSVIIPNGYVRLIGRVQMQNEGIDTVLGGQPPPGIDITPVLDGGDTTPIPGGGEAIVYVNEQEDGVTAEAGSMIRVTFYSPQHCGEAHDVYFDNLIIGTVPATLPPSCVSESVVEYVIPVAIELGTHHVHFTLAGDNVVYDDQEIQVVKSSQARIETGGIRWPVGTTINIELYAHPGGPDIDLFIKPKGAPDSDWEYIGTVQIDGNGDATGAAGLAYRITKSQGDYQLSSRPGTPGHDADVTTELARTEIAVLEACLTINQSIVCGQAQTVPAGARINIVLRNHAPGRTYSLYFVDRSLGTEDLIGNVTADQYGEGVAQYYIPFDQPDGSYLVESRDGGTVVATAEVIVSTPETPYIVIAGGDTWPAGSPITIQMQKHCDPPYDLYIGTGTRGSWAIEATIDTNLDTDAPPTCQRWVNYIIPPTYVGEYLIVSRKGNTDIAYADLTVELAPALTIDGGEFHVPGSPITIRLSGHVPSQNYSVYVVNLDTSEETLVAENFLPNASGAKTLTWNIPLAASGSYRVESRVYGTSEVVARAPLTIQAADLEIVSLRVPSNLPLAQEFPVTVTVRNNATFDIVGRPFDVDIYLDPSIPPNNPDSSLPPGDRKLWIASLGAGATTRVVGNITIYGGSTHDLWARVDTSRRIAETNELNNFAHSIVSVPTECSMRLTDTFDTLDSAWSVYVWGDGGKGVSPTPFAEVSGGVLNLNGRGSNTWVNNDQSSGGSVTLLRPLEGNYDLDVRVRVLAASSGSNTGKAGIEIRDSLDGGAVKVDYVRDKNDNRLQAGYRDFLYDGMESSNDASGISTPVWLRVKRLGNRFEFWYSTQPNPTQSDSDWTFQSSRDLPMGNSVFVGFIHASYNSNRTTSSRFDNFRVCAREATAPVEPPAGFKECSQLLENGDFQASDNGSPPGWIYPEFDPPVNRDMTIGHPLAPSILLPAWHYGAFPKPAWLYQEISMPDWVSNDATAQVEGFKHVNQLGEPDADPLYFVLRTTAGITVSTPVVIATGSDTPGSWDPFTSDDVMGSIANPADYAGQKLQAYFYSPNPGTFDTIFHLDTLEFNVCVQQPLPPPVPAPGTGAIRGSVQYLTTGGLIRPAPGAWVWIYAINGSLFKTFAIQDATYSFNDIPPGTYTMYAEYSDGTNLYFVIPPPIAVAANSVVTQNLLLAR
jgi:hypothetical protein